MPIFLFMVISFLGVWGDESFGSVCLHGIEFILIDGKLGYFGYKVEM